jgi:hypothetical protein
LSKGKDGESPEEALGVERMVLLVVSGSSCRLIERDERGVEARVWVSFFSMVDVVGSRGRLWYVSGVCPWWW